MRDNDHEEAINLINLYSEPHESMSDFIKRIHLFTDRGFDIIGYFEGKKVDTRDYIFFASSNSFKFIEEVADEVTDQFSNDLEQAEEINTVDDFNYNESDEPGYRKQLVKRRSR